MRDLLLEFQRMLISTWVDSCNVVISSPKKEGHCG